MLSVKLFIFKLQFQDGFKVVFIFHQQGIHHFAEQREITIIFNHFKMIFQFCNVDLGSSALKAEWISQMPFKPIYDQIETFLEF